MFCPFIKQIFHDMRITMICSSAKDLSSALYRNTTPPVSASIGRSIPRRPSLCCNFSLTPLFSKYRWGAFPCYSIGSLCMGRQINLIHSAQACFHSVQLDAAKNSCRFGKLHMLEIDGDQVLCRFSGLELCLSNLSDTGAFLNVFPDPYIRIDCAYSTDKLLP